jgi:hypothetical protein
MDDGEAAGRSREADHFHATEKVINMETLAFKINCAIMILERTIALTSSIL